MNINALPQNQNPSVWGPHTWATIHSLALHSDSTNENKSFNDFLTSLENLLPCTSCRNDFKEYLKKSRPTSGSVFEWTVELHNHVNLKTSKPVMTLEEARKMWISQSCEYSCTTKKPRRNINMNFCILVIFVLLFFLAWKNFQS